MICNTKNVSTVQTSQRYKHWIYDLLLVIPNRSFKLCTIYAMAVWVVGCSATLLKKSKRACIVFVWVFKLDLFNLKSLKRWEKKRLEPLLQFQNQRRRSFKTAKHDMCVDPNASIFTKTPYKWRGFLGIAVDSTLNHVTRAKYCAATCTKSE